MIEKTILDYLKTKLTVPVYMEEPVDAPGSFVLIEKTGSGRENYIQASTFAFQSYAESLYEAALLNETLKNVIDSLIVLDDIGQVRLNSDYNFTDTTTKRYRYQAVYDITHY